MAKPLEECGGLKPIKLIPKSACKTATNPATAKKKTANKATAKKTVKKK